MPEVITDPTVALVALVNQGALNAYADGQHLYSGRYALQQIVSAATVRKLIGMGHAESAGDEALPVVYPTLRGLEAAINAQVLPPCEEAEVVSAVLGSRAWEPVQTVTTPVVGLFLSRSQASSLVRVLASARTKASATAGTLIWATGGVVPPQLAIELQAEALPTEGATLELMSVPTKFRTIMNSLRRFRFVINVGKGSDPLLIHMGAGPQLRYLASLDLVALLEVLARVNPDLTADESYLALQAPHDGDGKRTGDVTGKSIS